MEQREGIKNFRETAKEWSHTQIAYRVAHWVLGILAIILAGLVAAKLPSIGDGCYRLIALASAFCTGIIAFASPKPNADRFKAALQILEDEIGKYDVEPSYTYDHVQAAAEIGGKSLAVKYRTRPQRKFHPPSGLSIFLLNHLKRMAGTTGLEPAASSVTGQRSKPLK